MKTETYISYLESIVVALLVERESANDIDMGSCTVSIYNPLSEMVRRGSDPQKLVNEIKASKSGLT